MITHLRCWGTLEKLVNHKPSASSLWHYESVRFYRNEDLSTTCQCRQHKLNPLSTQINIYCVMTNQTPALLVHRAPWARAAVMLLLSPSIFLALLPLELMYNLRRPPPRYIWKSRWSPLTVRHAISRPCHGKIGDCEQSRSNSMNYA